MIANTQRIKKAIDSFFSHIFLSDIKEKVCRLIAAIVCRLIAENVLL